MSVRKLGGLLLLCCMAAVVAVILAGGAWAAATEPQGLSADEERAVALVNADRAARGLPPLRVNMTLVALARDYAQDMIARNFFSHESPEGETFSDRLIRYGVKFRCAGENIGMNGSVEAAERVFMNSDGHRANILTADYSEVGIGVRRGADGAVYIVQEFIGQ